MLTAAAAIDESTGKGRGTNALPADSLALGMAFLLVLTVVQRLIGLVRNVLFCRMLDDEQLGLWSLGFSFLVLAAPLAVLGLPGSFGRYVEHFRQRGQLPGFLRRVTWATVFLGLGASAAICLGRGWFSWIIYTDASQATLVLVLGFALLATIGFNFLVELLTALRQMRAVSLLQFANSICFTVVGLALLSATSWGASGLAAAHAAACLLPTLAALPLVLRLGRDNPALPGEENPPRIWIKLLPYAAWIWTINILANLTEIADRYLVLHWSGLDLHAALGLVGQLHASRVVPVLMIGVAVLVGGAVLPYLSHDWEAGRKRLVSAHVNLALKLVGLAFTAGSVLVVLLAPLLFGWLLQGRYDGGLAVLPLSLIYCVWFSLALLAQNYLLCAEQNKLGGLAFAIALVTNVALNLLLLPSWGLHGAALAAALANGALLLSMLVLCRRVGMQIDPGTIVVCLSPLLLALGAWGSAAGAVFLVCTSLWSAWIFTDDEKTELLAIVARLLEGKSARQTAS